MSDLTAATTALVAATVEIIGTKAELLAWAVGTVDGGPNGNGEYPFTAADGTVILVPSAKKLEVLHGDPTNALAVLEAAIGQANAARLGAEAARDAAGPNATAAAQAVIAAADLPGKVAAASASASLSERLANATTDADVQGAPPGSRGAKFWALSASASASAVASAVPVAMIAADQHGDVQSFWPDPDNNATGGWQQDRPLTVIPTKVGGVSGVKITNLTAATTFSYTLPSTDILPVGGKFIVAFSILDAGLDAGHSILLQSLYNGSHTAITTVSATPAAPTRKSITLTRVAGQNGGQFYATKADASPALSATDYVTIGLGAAYPDTYDAPRPALNGRELQLYEGIGEQAAFAEALRRPNRFPDLYYTGLAANGSSEDATTPSDLSPTAPAFFRIGKDERGQPHFHVKGKNVWFNIPVAQLGSPGDTMSTFLRAQLKAVGGSNLDILMQFIRANGTSISTASLITGQGVRPHRRWASYALTTTIPAETAVVRLYLSASSRIEQEIKITVPSVHAGDLPFWRPGPLVATGSGGGLALDPTAIASGTTAQRPSLAAAGQFYYDTDVRGYFTADGNGRWSLFYGALPVTAYDFCFSTSGSDSNPGTSASPKQTVAHAAALATTGKRIAFKRGDTWRMQPFVNGNTNIFIGCYGDPNLPLPAFLGSTPVTAFTALGGGKYSAPAPGIPGGAATPVEPCSTSIVYANGVIEKLYLNADGDALKNGPIGGEWQFNSTAGTIEFYPINDPTGGTLEVSGPLSWKGNDSEPRKQWLWLQGNGQIAQQFSARFWADAGVLAGTNARLLNYEASYTGGDGVDALPTTTNVLLQGSKNNYNGRGWGLGGGPGDGWSFHNAGAYGATGTARLCEAIGNTQTGSGNQDGCRMVIEMNYFEDNWYNLNTYNGGSSAALAGDHLYRYNICVYRKLGNRPHYNNNGGSADVRVRGHNNTFWTKPDLAASFAFITADGHNNEFKNNIFSGPAQYAMSVPTALMASSFNIFHGYATRSRSDAYAWNTGPGDILATDPKLADPLNGLFVPAYDSVAIKSGTPLGYAADKYGADVPGNPDRGAVQR